ncbi:hypothetical protein LUZ63_009271 [Rhynchospora breviuscula]|uniref:Uncharacterized protein n=1 Tax=Rhynchospora breviuscula TaxID=2022672 RepID=A0A9Q0CER1_9POAL|nr:hypothetical protein LUZ63_009271 [Rhynchospora breviuscula]
MVPGFSRSISLPLSPSRSGKNSRAASHHVRSASLPCQSHPIISNLGEQIQAIRSFSANPEASFVWIEVGLGQIEAVLASLQEFLYLGQTQETLSQAASTDSVLEDFLILADIYSSFVSTIATLKQHQAEIQSALRRADKICLVSALKSQRFVEKEIAQLTYSLKNISKSRPLALASNASEAEITGIMAEAVSTTAVASMELFSGVVAILSAAASSTKTSSMTWLFRKLALNSSSNSRVSDEEFGVAEKFEQLEVYVGNVESCSERVFRRLINLRVSLLNISTPLL